MTPPILNAKQQNWSVASDLFSVFLCACLQLVNIYPSPTSWRVTRINSLRTGPARANEGRTPTKETARAVWTLDNLLTVGDFRETISIAAHGGLVGTSVIL